MSNRQPSPRVRLRAYISADADITFRIFQDAIMVTAAADYTPEQLTAWARPEQRGLFAWNQARRRRNSYVALVGEQIAGFSDVSRSGHIDMMFVAPRFARQGVARELITFLEKQSRSFSAKQLTADVSITARGFFEAFGFHVEAERHLKINGVALTNFRMVKPLEP